MFKLLKSLFGKPTLYMNVKSGEFVEKFRDTEEAILLDVRTPREFKTGHLHDAISANVISGDFFKIVAAFDKSKPIFVYCQTGSRSVLACEKLTQNGFKNVYNMAGGVRKWQGMMAI